MEFDAELDARGLICPLPVLKLRKRIAALAPGEVMRVQADDPAAIIDIPHFCAEAGHAFLGHDDAGDCQVFYVRRSE